MPTIGNLKDSTDDSVRVVMVCLIEEFECTTVIAVFKEEFLCVENFFQRVALNVFHIGNKKVYLGRYAVKEEAILARLTKEVELYKEFSPQRELLKSLNL